MVTVTVTSKRQVTLPKETCETLRVKPGDKLVLERVILNGETVWVFRPQGIDWSWIGSLDVPEDLPHDIQSIRASIARGRKPAER